MIDLPSRPTQEQLARFRALTMSERYDWLAAMLTTVHTLSTPEARASWRRIKEAQSSGFLSVAHAFARHLEAGRHEALGELLADVCVYHTGAHALEGPAAIVESYELAHRWARDHLEGVRYRSSVAALLPGVARITFEEHLEHGGESHVYRCQEQVLVAGNGRIERIEHIELAGEREALDRFLERVGVSRSFE